MLYSFAFTYFKIYSNSFGALLYSNQGSYLHVIYGIYVRLHLFIVFSQSQRSFQQIIIMKLCNTYPSLIQKPQKSQRKSLYVQKLTCTHVCAKTYIYMQLYMIYNVMNN